MQNPGRDDFGLEPKGYVSSNGEMRDLGLMGCVLGILILLCSCGAYKKTTVSGDNEEIQSAEANAGAAIPENQICRVELHDPSVDLSLIHI